MKRRLCRILALTTLVALFAAGCSAEETPEYANALERIKGEGKIVMATNPEWAPYEFENLNAETEEDKYAGADIELGRYIAQQLGVDFELSVMSFETVIESVAQGQADIGISAFAYKEDRAEAALLAGPYSVGDDYQGALVRKEDAEELSTVESLNNRTIGVQIGSLQYEIAEETLEGCEYVFFSNPADGVLSLQNGQVDAVVIDNAPAQEFVAANPGLKILDTAYAQEDYAIGVAKGNTQLLDAINGALEELQADGTLQAIVDKYITAE